MRRALWFGLGLWIAGTVGIRVSGATLLRPHDVAQTIVLYAVSFAVMALIVPRIFHRLRLERESWPAAATLLMLPTLLLDPFSCLFFGTVFPRADPAAAGVFGGWMLICGGGAVIGAWTKR
jgi:FtsH-binding integral membrane protein